MSLVHVWERERTALAANLAGVSPAVAGERLQGALSGLVRPYSDERGITPLQAAYAAYVLDALALAPPALLTATTTSAELSKPAGVRFAERRPGVGEAVLWLVLTTVIGAFLTVLCAYTVDPVVAGALAVVTLLGLVGTVSTVARLRPAVESFVQRYGRHSVPRTLRLMLRLVPARTGADPDPPPSVALTTQVAADNCLRWLDQSVRAVDQMLAKLATTGEPAREWLAGENTGHAVQELLGAVLKDDAERCSVAAQRLATALTAEGVVAVVFDGTNREFFDTAPSGRKSTQTLRPALVQHRPDGLTLLRRGLVAASVSTEPGAGR